jgi:hypothetical protein
MAEKRDWGVGGFAKTRDFHAFCVIFTHFRKKVTTDLFRLKKNN